MITKNEILKLIANRKDDLQKMGVRDIGLFGSYARNDQVEMSDIDILIDFYPEKETYDNLMAVYDLLEKLFAGKKVEVVTKNGLSPYIGPSILKDMVTTDL